MPKSIKKINLKGGSFWDPIQNTWNSLTYDIRNFWNNTKKNDSTANENYSSSSTNNNNSYNNPSSSYYSTNNVTRGGKKRKLKGGYSHPIYPNLASQASPYHGEPTAKVKWIGGKKRRKTFRKRKIH